MLYTELSSFNCDLGAKIRGDEEIHGNLEIGFIGMPGPPRSIKF
jgi:hypothetical protein